MPSHAPYLFPLVASLLAGSQLLAAPPATRPALPSAAVPPAAQTPRINASLADPAWQNAATLDLTHLATDSPADQPPPQPTRVQLLWSPEFLFIRFLCVDSDIFTPVAGRDAALFNGDVVEVFIDPVGDCRQYIELQISPNNDVMDKLFLATSEPVINPNGLLNDAFIRRDQWELVTWNFTGLRTATARTTLTDGTSGWIVDLAIPAAELLKRADLRKFKPMTLRANFVRYDQIIRASSPTGRELQSINWSPNPYGRPHRAPSIWGTLNLTPASSSAK